MSIKYNVELEITERVIKAMRSWDKSKENPSEREQAEIEIKNLLVNNRMVTAYEVSKDEFGLYELKAKVGHFMASNAYLYLFESYDNSTFMAWMVPHPITLREIKGRPFKIKELFINLDKKKETLW